MAKENNEQNGYNMPLLLRTEDNQHHHHSNLQDEENKITKDAFVLARTTNEKSCFQTIETALNNLKIVIRTIKNTNALYICPEDAWQRKVNNFMEQNGIFSLIGNITLETLETSNNQVEHVLTNMSNQIVNTLHNLFLCKEITIEQYEQMMYYNQSTIFHVNKLYFIPEIHNNEIIIQPMITCITNEPINSIACFVNTLLQPLIDFIIHTSFTFSSGGNAIEALEKYAQKGSLRSTTLFVKIDIHDLCTTLPHHLLIEALEKFLHIYVRNEQIDGTSTTTIIQLVQLILENQFYVYENKLYRQIAGGSICSSLIKGLVDIYLFHLTHNLYSKLFNKKEVIGRCLNQIFFTWNESKDELFTLLNQINFLRSKKYIHIKMTTSIDYKMEYLSAEISNHEGLLKTTVYHDINLEPYALPYILEIKRMSQDHQFLIRAALIRALVYCSNVNEFENERLYIELSFKINGVSIDVIQKAVQDFLVEFNIFVVDKCIDEDTYQNVRQDIGRQIPRRVNKYILQERERQREKRRQRRQRRRTAALNMPTN